MRFITLELKNVLYYIRA